MKYKAIRYSIQRNEGEKMSQMRKFYAIYQGQGLDAPEASYVIHAFMSKLARDNWLESNGTSNGVRVAGTISRSDKRVQRVLRTIKIGWITKKIYNENIYLEHARICKAEPKRRNKGELNPKRKTPVRHRPMFFSFGVGKKPK